ncbi:MAG: hypothetical protein QOI89_2010 [Solirubrobacteraceae bacterium]|jgi:muconolactone D-isomerase|nr:hypothetical protein [Solirubrobacteraceae bacterium]
MDGAGHGMQQFLVSIRTRLPPELPEERRTALQARERDYVKKLHAQGTIHRIWRVPGQTASVGVWDAVDATELHEHLAALPLFAWLDITVTPLARHFLEVEREESR